MTNASVPERRSPNSSSPSASLPKPSHGSASAGLGLQPEWDAPEHVLALMTQRGGGVSVPPYDSLNLGDHVGDDPRAYTANRARVAQVLGLTPCFMKQVHGTHVHVLHEGSQHDGIEADAVVCATPGLAATIMVADCLPVLFAHARLPIVAAAHAGWRGLAGGVLQASLAAMAEQAHCCVQAVARETHVWLGPCIGPDAFEVGPDVRDAFADVITQCGDANALFVAQPGPGGKYMANLQGLARCVLRSQGVSAIAGNDGSASWCTVGNAQQYFSYRRDQGPLGASGRMAAFIGLRA
jgi:polyphenol oxidase